ncbi:MAG: DUF1501 domain-containing protein, partial [Planctomycetes bacterium]|nr:DUF1501 domain-containing protein [Planctomycetota bacterium]
MLTLLDPFPVRHCQGYSRRELLQIGSLALGGLALADLFRWRARAAEAGRLTKDRSVVLLFLQGGPSQIETFDPKMAAPEGIRSIFGEVKTVLPGVTFGGTFPKLAALADRLAVVRSFASGNADHQNYVSVAGGNSLKVPLGTLYARVVGANHPRTGIPTNTLVTPEAVASDLKLPQNFETQSLQKLVAASQSLGAGYGFFDPSGGGPLRQDLELQVPRERFDDRRQLLRQLDGFQRRLDATRVFESVSAYEQRAYEVVVRGVAQAFDLSREDPRTVARYDTSSLFGLDEVHKWGDMRRSSNLLGKQLLLARRLVEAGCGFVTVMDAGWDMHSNGNSPKGLAGMKWLGPQVDHAVSAFLEDLRERGLSEQVLLVITGEMGRTPKVNKDGGRDHWANLTPLLLAGGGLKMGQVVGTSDRQAGAPAGDQYTPANLLATVMHTLLDINLVRVTRDVPQNVL